MYHLVSMIWRLSSVDDVYRSRATLSGEALISSNIDTHLFSDLDMRWSESKSLMNVEAIISKDLRFPSIGRAFRPPWHTNSTATSVKHET